MVKCGVKAFEHMSFLFVKILFNGQFIDNHFLKPINYKKTNQNEKNACEMLTKGEFTSLMLEMFKVVYGLVHFPTHFSTFTFLLLFFLTQIESSTIKYLFDRIPNTANKMAEASFAYDRLCLHSSVEEAKRLLRTLPFSKL